MKNPGKPIDQGLEKGFGNCSGEGSRKISGKGSVKGFDKVSLKPFQVKISVTVKIWKF